MTLKELLDEQEIEFDKTFLPLLAEEELDGKRVEVDYGDLFVPRKDIKDFLRQSSIETAKWVIKFIYKTTPEDSIETQRLDKNLLDDKYFIAGHDAAINDLVCQLNKSIEDHERE